MQESPFRIPLTRCSASIDNQYRVKFAERQRQGLPIDLVAASAENVRPVIEAGAMTVAKAGSAVDMALI